MLRAHLAVARRAVWVGRRQLIFAQPRPPPPPPPSAAAAAAAANPRRFVATFPRRFVATSTFPNLAGGKPTPTITPPPTPNSSNPTLQIRDAVREALQDFDRRHTYNGWHLTKFLGAVGVGSIIVLALFYDDVLRWLSGQGSVLAQQTIQDKQLQKEVDRVTKVTTNALLNDPEVIEVTVEFLLRLLEKEETRSSVVKFLSVVIVDKSTVNALSQLLKDPATVRQLQGTFNILLQDPSIQQSLNIMVQNLLADPTTAKQFENLVVDLFQQQRVKSVVADFFGEVLRYDSVVNSATDSSRLIVEDLSKDTQVHKNLASAGTSAVKRMVIPPFVFNRAEKAKKHHDDDDASSVSTGASSSYDEDGKSEEHDMDIEVLSEEIHGQAKGLTSTLEG